MALFRFFCEVGILNRGIHGRYWIAETFAYKLLGYRI